MRWWSAAARVLVVAYLLVGCAGAGQPGASTGTRPSASTRTGPGTALPTPTATATPSRVSVGRDAWVAVSVATLWRSPQAPRAIDAPALRNPAAIRAWLSGMSDRDRLGLVGRADTQALLGDRVVVTTVHGAFARVVVPDQPTPLDSRGYPGWVPLVQLTASAPPAATTAATVVSRTAWLHADDATGDPVVEVSFATRLPVVGTADGLVRVGLPGGRVLRARPGEVTVTGRAEPPLPREGDRLVRSATMFTGLPYLWAGTSGFGFDCSGLTMLVYRAHGVTIPRDAGPQAREGDPVGRTALRPGDLLFYASDGVVHHVSMYAGDDRMVHAPSTGHTVVTVPVDTPGFASEFSGARRFIS